MRVSCGLAVDSPWCRQEIFCNQIRLISCFQWAFSGIQYVAAYLVGYRYNIGRFAYNGIYFVLIFRIIWFLRLSIFRFWAWVRLPKDMFFLHDILFWYEVVNRVNSLLTFLSFLTLMVSFGITQSAWSLRNGKFRSGLPCWYLPLGSLLDYSGHCGVVH